MRPRRRASPSSTETSWPGPRMSITTTAMMPGGPSRRCSSAGCPSPTRPGSWGPTLAAYTTSRRPRRSSGSASVKSSGPTGGRRMRRSRRPSSRRPPSPVGSLWAQGIRAMGPSARAGPMADGRNDEWCAYAWRGRAAQPPSAHAVAGGGAMTTQKRFVVFDSDSHVVEPRDVWEKYLEPEYRVLGKHALWREDGKTNSYLKVNGEMFRDTMNPNIPRHAIWRPGMTWDAIGELDPHTRHAMNEGVWDPQARLRDMDAMGVDQTLLYPTWFAEGFHLVHDPDVAYALARAYNNWIADFCQAAPDRLFAAAMVPLQNMDFALEELQRVARIPCFCGAFLRPMFIEGRYFTHPYYDPLWAELENLGLTAAVHPTPGLWNPEWTS